MGIKGLTNLIEDNAPDSIVKTDIQNYFGRIIAIDASTSLYQFVVSVRSDESGQYNLTNDYGETTSHLVGMFYRTIRMLTSGIKPVFVFDGKPPELKKGEIAKRKKKKEEAQQNLDKANEEAADKETIKKLNKVNVHVTPEMNEEAKKLLRLMGVPVIEAPCEAEAQCAALCKANKVWASGSEDMDTLTCGSPVLLRHLTYSEARKEPILEFHISRILSGLGLTMEQFIDLCILLGCDYSEKIKGIGPVRALEFIKKYGSIENILKSLDNQKFKVPEPFPYQEIRDYFKQPEVKNPEECDITFNDPDEEGLIKFLVEEKQFKEDRVRAGIAKIKLAKQKGTQSRITSFFTMKPSDSPQKPKVATPKKGAMKPSASPSKKRPRPGDSKSKQPSKKQKY